jgi:hypothetical protein
MTAASSNGSSAAPHAHESSSLSTASVKSGQFHAGYGYANVGELQATTPSVPHTEQVAGRRCGPISSEQLGPSDSTSRQGRFWEHRCTTEASSSPIGHQRSGFPSGVWVTGMAEDGLLCVCVGEELGLPSCSGSSELADEVGEASWWADIMEDAGSDEPGRDLASCALRDPCLVCTHPLAPYQTTSGCAALDRQRPTVTVRPDGERAPFLPPYLQVHVLRASMPAVGVLLWVHAMRGGEGKAPQLRWHRHLAWPAPVLPPHSIRVMAGRPRGRASLLGQSRCADGSQGCHSA